MALAVWINLNCEHADPIEPQPAQSTFSSIQTNIFNRNCSLSGCHLGSSAPFGLDLSAGKAYNNIDNVQSQENPSLLRVEPGNPDNSYLVRKIEGAPGIVGARMPFGWDPLNQEQINAMRQWIANGAIDD